MEETVRPMIMKRYSPPSNQWDTAPYGTLAEVTSNFKIEIWQQCSLNEEKPHWQKIEPKE
jgi:hypothetical protein